MKSILVYSPSNFHNFLKTWSHEFHRLPLNGRTDRPLNRYALSSWSNVQKEADGSLKLLIAPKPGGGIPESRPRMAACIPYIPILRAQSGGAKRGAVPPGL